MKILVIFIPLMIGCVPWETKEDANKMKVELNEFHNNFTKKTGELNSAVTKINSFLLKKAKTDKVQDDVILLAKNESKLDGLAEDFSELSKHELEMSKQGGGLFMDFLNGLLGGIMDSPLLSMIITMMGGGGILGAVKHVAQGNKLKRVKMKAKKYAKSQEHNDIDDDEDLA